MDDKERACELLQHLSTRAVWDGDKIALIAAAFAEVEREALERAANLCRDKAKAHAALAQFGDNDHARRREGMEAAYKNAEHLIRALSFKQSGISAPINTTGATVIVHPGGVIHMGADPAASDPTKALAKLFATLWNERWNQSDEERTAWHYRGIEVGLLDGSEVENERISLSALGRAALRLAENGGRK